LFFYVDKLSRTPIYEQIITGITKMIESGALTAGDRLPSVRELSNDLSINPNTIQKAYLELDRRGLTASSPGRGSFVTAEAAELIKKTGSSRIDEFVSLLRELRNAGADRTALINAVNEVFDKTEGN